MALAFPGIMEILIIGMVILFIAITYYVIKKAIKKAIKDGIKESEKK